MCLIEDYEKEGNPRLESINLADNASFSVLNQVRVYESSDGTEVQYTKDDIEDYYTQQNPDYQIDWKSDDENFTVKLNGVDVDYLLLNDQLVPLLKKQLMTTRSI